MPKVRPLLPLVVFFLVLSAVVFHLTLRAIAQTPSERDAAVQKLLADLEATRSRYANVPRKDGEFLNLLVKATQAKNVLEIGTSNGYSAIWICLGLEETGGKLTTIEINPRRVQEAKANLSKAGLAHRVTFLEGDAHKVVERLPGPFDFIFIDADKGNEMDYFNKLFPKLQPGGVIVLHNAIRFQNQMKAYLDHVSNHPQLNTVILSLTMDDGFAVSYKKRK
ncbi:MAG: O-methyltransferase [Abditibacteriales bacterium]|nr:O-methyltransferase [Abditibacteriales bacterium]MDW8365153.1 O-methyltransferase [Abditibacteriales bacterium]